MPQTSPPFLHRHRPLTALLTALVFAAELITVTSSFPSSLHSSDGEYTVKRSGVSERAVPISGGMYGKRGRGFQSGRLQMNVIPSMYDKRDALPFSGGMYGKRDSMPFSGGMYGKRAHYFQQGRLLIPTMFGKRAEALPFSGGMYGKRDSMPFNGGMYGKRSQMPFSGGMYGKRDGDKRVPFSGGMYGK